MYIVVKHNISNPAKFWDTAQASIPTLPKDVKLHSTLPNREGSNAVCLWEANSIDAVKAAIEPLLGEISRNEYFEVDAKKAIGLPK
jgi:hypothetical protein